MPSGKTRPRRYSQRPVQMRGAAVARQTARGVRASRTVQRGWKRFEDALNKRAVKAPRAHGVHLVANARAALAAPVVVRQALRLAGTLDDGVPLDKLHLTLRHHGHCAEGAPAPCATPLAVAVPREHGGGCHLELYCAAVALVGKGLRGCRHVGCLILLTRVRPPAAGVNALQLCPCMPHGLAAVSPATDPGDRRQTSIRPALGMMWIGHTHATE